MDIIKAHAIKNLCYVSARKMKPSGIVVHSTGVNNPNLKRYVDCPSEVGANPNGNHWNNPTPDGKKVCVHAFIGYDKNKKVRVAEILPLNICCWGVGSGRKGSYNYNPAYIQFEICEDELTDKVYYRQAFDVAVEYCAYLCKKFRIPVSKIVGHREAHALGYGSNHADPEHWMKLFGEDMTDFRRLVSEKLKKDSDKATDTKLAKGDLVSILKNATYYNGQAIPNWVKSQKWYVKDTPKGDRVVIDKNEKCTNSICSPISSKYLVVVKKSY